MFGMLLLPAHLVYDDVLVTAWTPTEIDERLERQVCNGILTEALRRSWRIERQNIIDYDLHFWSNMPVMTSILQILPTT